MIGENEPRGRRHLPASESVWAQVEMFSNLGGQLVEVLGDLLGVGDAFLDLGNECLDVHAEDTPTGVSGTMAHTTLILNHSTSNTEDQTTYEIHDEPLKVGTDDKSNIKLYDGQNARFHAIIERDERGQLAILHLGNGPLIEGSVAGKVQTLALARGVKFRIGLDEFYVEDITVHLDPAPLKGYFWIEGPNNSFLLVNEMTKRTVAAVQYDDADRWTWALIGGRSGGISDGPDDAKAAAEAALKNAPPETLKIFGRTVTAQTDGVGTIYEAERFPFRGKIWTAPEDPTGGLVPAGPDKFHWALFHYGVPGAPPLKEGQEDDPKQAALLMGKAVVGLLFEMNDACGPSWY